MFVDYLNANESKSHHWSFHRHWHSPNPVKKGSFVCWNNRLTFTVKLNVYYTWSCVQEQAPGCNRLISFCKRNFFIGIKAKEFGYNELFLFHFCTACKWAQCNNTCILLPVLMNSSLFSFPALSRCCHARWTRIQNGSPWGISERNLRYHAAGLGVEPGTETFFQWNSC